MYNVVRVALPGFLQNGLKYLTLDIVCKLLTTVSPAEEIRYKSCKLHVMAESCESHVLLLVSSSLRFTALPLP